MISAIAPRVKPQPQIAGYIRLTRRAWAAASRDYAEEAVWVQGAAIVAIEPWHGTDGSGLLGATVTLVCGRTVQTRMSVDAVMALLSDLEGVSRG